MKRMKLLKIFNFRDDEYSFEYQKIDIILLGIYFIYQTTVGVIYNLMISKLGILKNYNRLGAITDLTPLFDQL